MQEHIHTLVRDFFTGLGITIQNLEIQVDGDDINIRVETPDSSLIIGMHGKSIDSFQHLLSRMLEKKVEKFVHVHLEVNDYMKQKDERLFRFLESKIAFATSTGKSIRIPNLTAYERKKAHSYISEKKIDGLKTQSEGEGEDRALVVSYAGALIAQTNDNSHATSSTKPLGEDLSEDGVGI